MHPEWLSKSKRLSRGTLRISQVRTLPAPVLLLPGQRLMRSSAETMIAFCHSLQNYERYFQDKPAFLVTPCCQLIVVTATSYLTTDPGVTVRNSVLPSSMRHSSQVSTPRRLTAYWRHCNNASSDIR